MKTIKRDNATISYHEYGKGDITLLFVHGSYIDQSYWSAQVEFFSKKYKVVTFDLPGHGLSGKGRTKWSIEGFADDLVEVIEKLQLDKVILVGHSMGADICLIATSKSDKIIGFISIDYFKAAGTKFPDEMVDGILENLKKDMPGTNENYVRTGLLTEKTPKAIGDRVIKDYRNAYEPMAMATMPELFKMYSVQQRLLATLNFKLHLINVSYSATDERALKRYVTNGYDIIYLEGSCHYPMLEAPNSLNDAIAFTVDEIATLSLV